MASNSKSTGLGNGYTLQAYFNQGERVTTSNYSKVYVEAKLTSTNTNWSSSYASYLRVYWHDNRENYDRLVSEIAMYGCSQWSNYYASGTIDVYHNNDGNLSGYAYATFTKGGTSSYAPSTGGVTTDWTALDKIDRYAVTNSVTGSDIEESFKVNYTKYVDSYKYKLRISIPSVVMLEKIDYNSSGATFTLSNASIQELYSRMSSNTITLGFAVETWNSAGTSVLSSGNEKQITAKITNANPIFSDFEFEDVNPTTVALTGSSSINVNGYSNIRTTISTANKAEAVKGATISKYQFRVGNDTPIDINYSSDSSVSGTVNGASNGVYNVYAIDSRQNSTLVTKLATSEVSYQPIYIDKQTSGIERNDNQVGEHAILTLNGTLWNNSFGLVTNSIKSVTYQFKKVGEQNWTTGTTTITPTVSDNKFSFEGQIAGDNQDTTWDLDSVYNVEVIITDELSEAKVELILNSATPTLSLDEEGVGVMCGYNSTLGGKLQVKGDLYVADSTGSNWYNILDKIEEANTYKQYTETKVGTWIDDKPLYRTVFMTNSLINTDYENKYAHNISNVDFIKITEAFFFNTNSHTCYLIPVIYYEGNSNLDRLSVKADRSYVQFFVQTEWNTAWEKYVVLEYTKTTDMV